MFESINNLDRVGKLQLISMVVASVLFGLSLIFGIFSGISYGQSSATVSYVQKIKQALQFYNTDQGRYPSADQFYNQRILVPDYLTAFPVPADITGSCKNYNNFDYTQQSIHTFALQFCLTTGAQGITAGLHSLTDQGLQ